MHELLGKVAVVGENQHALGVGVEPADVVEGLQCGWQQIVDCLPAEFVAARADIAAGFVENDDDFLLRENPLAIDADRIRFGNACRQLDAGTAVDLDTTGSDQLIASTPRTDGT